MTSFRGWIAALGSTSGVRIVVGSWDRSPFGRVDDAMVAWPDGRRVLYCPTPELAHEIRARYRFDDVVHGPVDVDRRGWSVRAPGLELELTIGAQTPLGRALRLVPSALRERAWWARACDPIARTLLPGVRTHVRVGDLRLWYAASDHRRLTAVRGAVDGLDLGAIAPVRPPVEFGGSSAPPTPSLTRLSSHRLG